MAPLLIDSLVTGNRTTCDEVAFSLDSYFARTDTANPDSGDVHSPKRALAKSVMGRLEGDETKPGSKLKNRREVSAPRRIGSAVLA